MALGKVAGQLRILSSRGAVPGIPAGTRFASQLCGLSAPRSANASLQARRAQPFPALLSGPGALYYQPSPVQANKPYLPELASVESGSELLKSAMPRAALPQGGCHVFKRFSSIKASSPQVYAIPTYDAIFKRVLSDDKVRASFLSTFLPKGIKVESSKVLDPAMNPFESFQLLRDFISDDETKGIVAKLKGFPGLRVCTSDSTQKMSPKMEEDATGFLKEIIMRYDEILRAFPKPQYNGTMDLVCKLSTEEYALVEMQVVNQTFWDGRALAYAAAFYGNQLLRGQDWNDLRKVIGINILGGSRAKEVYWKDTPQEYVRYYRFQEQLHETSRYIDGIELIQYSIGHAPIHDAKLPQALRDWCTFFRQAHRMTGEEPRQQLR